MSIFILIYGFIAGFLILRYFDKRRLGENPWPTKKQLKIAGIAFGGIAAAVFGNNNADRFGGTSSAHCRGDASCEGAVLAHINSMDGKEVNTFRK